MPEYIVKTKGRNLVISADHYRFEFNPQHYEFFCRTETDGYNRTVATVPDRDVIAIVKKENLLTDFSDDYLDADDPKYTSFSNHSNIARTALGEPDNGEYEDHDDTYLDCRFEEFLESQEFFNAVADVFHAFVEDDPEPEVGPVRIAKFDGEYQWGFNTPKGFVGFGGITDSDKETAQECRVDYLSGNTEWHFDDLSEEEK